MTAHRTALAAAAYAGFAMLGAIMVSERSGKAALVVAAMLAVGGVAGIIRTMLPLED